SMGLGRHQLRRGVERFEDGTPPFLVAGAVPAALGAAAAADRPRLARHLDELTGRLIAGLDAIRHRDGGAAIKIHGPKTTAARGAIVAFTVEDARGGAIPFWKVEDAARKAGLAVRGGCFCNPGCAERAFALHPAVAQPCLDALGEDFTIPLFAECLGSGPVGAVRISLGLGSVRADVDRALAMLQRYSNC
ncbi:MAG: aminotransferase class V-fold PLP-dependent enzyme, partial [Rhodanobacter sp.]